MGNESLRELRKKHSLEHATFLNLLQAANELTQGVAELLKPAGLTPTQYNVLRVLRGAGEEPLTCGEMGDRLIARDPDVTRLLDRLERNGLISRERSEEDRRVVVTRITEKGRRLVDRLDEPVSQLHRVQLGHLGKEKLAALAELLEEAREGVR
jgi:DNA-binding MarR family transcriptional regulator